jgi:hypothetical protein
MALDNMQTTRLERKFAISDEAGLQVQNPLFHAPGRNREPLKKTPECMEQPDAGSKESSTMTKIALNGERSPIKIARYTEPGKNWQLEIAWESVPCTQLFSRRWIGDRNEIGGKQLRHRN